MKNNNRVLYALALVKLIIPFLLQHPIYEPHRDEMLYLAEGSHMAWGFMEVPPMLSVFAWLTHIFGDGLFWVKFWPSLFGALTYLVTGKIILSVGGRTFALLLGVLPFIFGAYLRVHFLFQPNFLEIFFCTLIAYTLIRFIQTEENKWLYLFGICCGLGMQSKYSIAFFITSILLGLLITKQRKIFTKKHLYFAALAALFLFLPNLIWQYKQHFPFVFHMEKLQRTQLQYISPASFLIDQLIMNFPCVIIWITGLWSLLFVAPLKKYRFIGWAYFLVIGLLLLGHGKNYYALGAYPVLFAFGAYQLEQVTNLRFKIMRYVLVIIPCFFGYWLVPIALPILPPKPLAEFYEKTKVKKLGVLKWEDGKNHPLPQDFADMLGWKEMAEKTAKVYHSLPDSVKQQTMVYGDNYGEAGALNFYRKKLGLPETYSDNASYIFWMPDHFTQKYFLFVTDELPEADDLFFTHWHKREILDSVTQPLAREYRAKIILYSQPDDSVRIIAEQHTLRDKNQFKRR